MGERVTIGKSGTKKTTLRTSRLSARGQKSLRILHIIWLRNTPSSRLVVEFSLYKCRIPFVTSTNGLPETKLMVSVLPTLPPSKGVESLVDLLDEETEELVFSTEGEVSFELVEVTKPTAASKSVYVSMVTSLIFRLPLARSRKD